MSSRLIRIDNVKLAKHKKCRPAKTLAVNTGYVNVDPEDPKPLEFICYDCGVKVGAINNVEAKRVASKLRREKKKVTK